MDINLLKRYNVSEIQSAGPRYTPSQNSDAPNLYIQAIEDQLDALSFSKEFRKKVSSFHQKFDKTISDGGYAVSEIFKKRKRSPADILKDMEGIINSKPNNINQHLKNFLTSYKAVNQAIGKRLSTIYKIEEERRKIGKDNNQDTALQNERYRLNQFSYVLNEIHEYFTSVRSVLISKNCLLLLGQWGTGKTHALCDYVRRTSNNQHILVFSLAQNFPISTEPFLAVCQKSGLTKNFEDLLAMLERAGKRNKNRSLIIIDGINEGDRDEWKKAVKYIHKKLKPYTHIGIVLSCRTPFEQILAEEHVLKKYERLYHGGFSEIEFEAQEAFFNFYKVPLPEVPLLSEEFSRPLTLKLICEALEGLSQKKKRSAFTGIASGQKGMTYVFESYIKKISLPIEKAYKLQEGFCWWLLKGSTKTLDKTEDGFAVRMATTHKEFLSHKDAIAIILNLTGWASEIEAQNFLKALLHSGVLFEHYIWHEGKYLDVVRLPYQKFSDHIIARHLVRKYLSTTSSVGEIRRCFYNNQPLGKIFQIKDPGYQYNMPNWAEALMIEFPESIKRLGEENRELYFFLPKNNGDINSLFSPFLNSLLWRSFTSYSSGTDKIVGYLLDNGKISSQAKILDVLLALSVKKGHPYSAKRLSDFLFNMSMEKRDLIWSEFLRKSYASNAPNKIISWILSLSKNSLSRATAKNCLIVLMWMLTSVKKVQRDRATKAIFKIGLVYPDMLFEQVLFSLKINDTYVTERMIAAAYGVAMNKWAARKKSFSKHLVSFAQDLAKDMFRPDAKFATHHTVIRDNALGCIEIARMLDHNCIANKYRKYLKPPFSYIPSPFKKVEDVSESVIAVTKPAFHMDFRNYTVGRLVSNRNNYQEDHPEYQGVLKQLKGRMYDLGYRYPDFEKIDLEITGRDYSGRSEDATKIERYGKKYAWIAYYEMYGYRQANKLLCEDRYEPRITETTIDPSFPEATEVWRPRLPNVFSRKFTGIGDWLINGPTPRYNKFLSIKNVRNKKGPWVLLNGHINQSHTRDGRKIFAFIKAFLVQKKDISSLRNRFAADHYPLSNSITGHWNDYYTFAGEIPWSTKHAFDLRHTNGKPKPNYQKLFSKSKFIPFSKAEETVEAENDLEVRGEVLFKLVALQGKWVETPGIRVEIPIHSHAWEGYHSILNDIGGFIVPAPAMSDYLGLSFRNQSPELLDDQGKLATIYTHFSNQSDETINLFYLRKDLLEKYLLHTKQTLVWIVWGERGMHYNFMGQLNAVVQEKKIFEKHLQIHKKLVKY